MASSSPSSLLERHRAGLDWFASHARTEGSGIGRSASESTWYLERSCIEIHRFAHGLARRNSQLDALVKSLVSAAV
jgi:hypothetical protein